MIGRFTDLVAAVLVLAGIAWAVTPSSAFIRTVSFEVDDDQALFVRELPFTDWVNARADNWLAQSIGGWAAEGIQARWRSEITLVGRGTARECETPGWTTSTYQPQDDNSVVFTMGDWARECLDAGPPFYITTTRSVLLFNWLPLLPKIYRTDILGNDT